jgi:outer membrane protein
MMKKSLRLWPLQAWFCCRHAEAGILLFALVTSVSPDEGSSLGKDHQRRGYRRCAYGNAGAELPMQPDSEIDFSYYHQEPGSRTDSGHGHPPRRETSGAGALLTTTKLGSVDLLPPTLTLQWHFMPDQSFDPYVGAGVNYTYFGTKFRLYSH